MVVESWRRRRQTLGGEDWYDGDGGTFLVHGRPCSIVLLGVLLTSPVGIVNPGSPFWVRPPSELWLCVAAPVP